MKWWGRMKTNLKPTWRVGLRWRSYEKGHKYPIDSQGPDELAWHKSVSWHNKQNMCQVLWKVRETYIPNFHKFSKRVSKTQALKDTSLRGELKTDIQLQKETRHKCWPKWKLERYKYLRASSWEQPLQHIARLDLNFSAKSRSYIVAQKPQLAGSGRKCSTEPELIGWERGSVRGCIGGLQ